MKKIISFLVVMVLAVPLAFLLGGCGGGSNQQRELTSMEVAPGSRNMFYVGTTMANFDRANILIYMNYRRGSTTGRIGPLAADAASLSSAGFLSGFGFPMGGGQTLQAGEQIVRLFINDTTSANQEWTVERTELEIPIYVAPAPVLLGFDNPTFQIGDEPNLDGVYLERTMHDRERKTIPLSDAAITIENLDTSTSSTRRAMRVLHEDFPGSVVEGNYMVNKGAGYTLRTRGNVRMFMPSNWTFQQIAVANLVVREEFRDSGRRVMDFNQWTVIGVGSATINLNSWRQLSTHNQQAEVTSLVTRTNNNLTLTIIEYTHPTYNDGNQVIEVMAWMGGGSVSMFRFQFSGNQETSAAERTMFNEIIASMAR